MTDAVLHDRVGDDEFVRTVTFDVPADELIGGLLSCEAYLSHQRYTAEHDIALAANGGYAVAKVFPTDDIPEDELSLEDFVTNGPEREYNKSGVMFRQDFHDVDAVLPVIREVAEEIRGEPDG